MIDRVNAGFYSSLYSLSYARLLLFHSPVLILALRPQVGKTSAFIGPFVSSAIITAADNNDNMPFAFLFGLYVVADLLTSISLSLSVTLLISCLLTFILAVVR